MSESAQVKQRGKIIVDRSFQYRYLIFCLGLTVLLLLLFSGIMMIIVKRLSGWWASTLVIEEIVRLLVMNGLFILLVGVSSGIYALFVSHRVAGPAYRLEMMIRQIIKGEYESEIKLRRKDYLSNIAYALNELSKKLKSKDKLIDQIQADALKLKEALEKDRPQLKEWADNIILKVQNIKEGVR